MLILGKLLLEESWGGNRLVGGGGGSKNGGDDDCLEGKLRGSVCSCSGCCCDLEAFMKANDLRRTRKQYQHTVYHVGSLFH